MANIFKQYKDSRTSATLFTETGSMPSALRSSATDGQKAAALDLQVSLPPFDDSYPHKVRFIPTSYFDKSMSHSTRHLLIL
jgi:hypothetical protein